MPKTSYFICVPCFILPEFPLDCSIVKDNNLFLRDVLCSYKKNGGYNDHIYWGGQYDPHYEDEIAPQFKMCHKPQRSRIKKLADSDLYDRIFLIFRGNKRYLDKSNKHYITGFYEIDQKKIYFDPNYEDYVLYSNNAVMVGNDQAIDITEFLKKTRMYISRFSSETHNWKYHNIFLNYIELMNDMENKLTEYIDETKRIEKIFKYYEFEEGLYNICQTCMKKQHCPLAKRSNKYKLHHNLPEKVSDLINDFYKSTIKINELI